MRDKNRPDFRSKIAGLPEKGKRRRGLALYEALVKTERRISSCFPQAALEECAFFSAHPDPELMEEKRGLPGGQGRSGRKDLRGLAFVTIDDQDARDFDDAGDVEQ
jgi:exoribonuclease R